MYATINSYREGVDFDVQDGEPGEWRRVVDTGGENASDFLEGDEALPLKSPRYRVAARSAVMLTQETAA